MSDNFLENLNDSQIDAVKSTEGYIRVVAGPGSGKTRTLTNRFGYLVSECGIPIKNILCITFTNKAADVMKSRLRKHFGNSFNGNIYTFHGFCAKVLRDEIYHLGFPKSFNIFDDTDKESVYKEIFEKLSLSKKEMTYKQLAFEIHTYKECKSSEYIDFLTDSKFDKKIEAPNYIIEYLKCQRKNYYLDFDDLILMCIHIFDKYKDILEKYQDKYQYVLVDEFQDVTSNEFVIAKLMSEKNKNLFVVGDPDQMIYSWRGAKDYIYNFDTIFPDCKTIYLDINYRSSPEIINLSNSLIKHNTKRLDKTMKSVKPSSALPIYYNAKSREDEASWICDRIKAISVNDVSLGNIAIIYRTNRNSRFIEEALLKNNLPYRVYGSVGFYERKEIKDLLAYLRFLINHDDISFRRIINTPSRGFGDKKMNFLLQKQDTYGGSLYENMCKFKNESIFKGAKIDSFIDLINNANFESNKKVSDILHYIYQQSGYEKKLMTEDDEDRLDNVSELLESIKQIENLSDEDISLEEYISTISLVSNNDNDNDSNDKIKLMTAHISKGQEFEYVFVCALNENNFPISRAIDQKEIEEERRLAYVAFSRAEKMLFLTSANGYDYISGDMMPSRFIYDIEANCIDKQGAAISNNDTHIIDEIIENKMRLINENCDFCENNIGKLVEHKVFGSGKILSVDKESGSYVIKFEQLLTIRKISYNSDSLNILNKKPDIDNQNKTYKPVYLSINDIIRIYGISRYKAMKIVHSGKLDLYKQGNKYLVKQENIEEYFDSIKRLDTIKTVVAIILFIILFILLILIFTGNR